MKPKRFFFHQPQVFGMPLRCGVPLVLGFMVFITGLDAEAGDILRGGAGGGGGGKPRAGTNGGTPTPAATDAARANARDMLARTNRTLDSMRAMQNAARNAAGKGANNLGRNPANPTITLPRVPNGLVTGGLKVSPLVAHRPHEMDRCQTAETNRRQGQDQGHHQTNRTAGAAQLGDLQHRQRHHPDI